MKDRKELKKSIIIASIGLLLLLMIAVFCYASVEKTIVGNEQESLKSLVKVSAQSMEASLKEKENLVSTLFSRDMKSEMEVEAALLKTREKGEYVVFERINQEEEWFQQVAAEASNRPWDVIVGPVQRTELGYYALYMTKAVSVNGYISGYAKIEIDLDELYIEEQALSSLELENSRYCIVKNAEGEIIMPSDYHEDNISLSQKTENGCTIEWVYETKGVTPERTRKLIAFETIGIGTELCV